MQTAFVYVEVEVVLMRGGFSFLVGGIRIEGVDGLL